MVIVLWCVVILSTVTYSVLDSSRYDLRISRNFGDRVQARYLALGGLEYAKAVLLEQITDSRLSADSRELTLYNNSELFKDIELGPGMFRIVRMALPSEMEEESGLIFGILDEERFLNLNHSSATEIAKLPNLNEQVAAAIVDWRDADSKINEGGAESEYYENLSFPLAMRNGPIQIFSELLYVRGVEANDMLGEDGDGDGFLDPNERDFAAQLPLDDGDSQLNQGWLQYACLESGIQNLDATGNPRISIASAVAEDFSSQEGVDAELAEAIILYRDEKSFSNVLDLLQVEGMTERPKSGGKGGETEWIANGEKLVDQELLKSIADKFCSSPTLRRLGVINVNTSGVEVLSCLPGMNEELAQAVVDYRGLNGSLKSIVELLEVPGFTESTVKGLEPRLDVRSGTFRIQSEGLVPRSGARSRITITVRVSNDSTETLSYREDL